QLRVDSLDVRQRVDLTGHVNDVSTLEGAYHVGDRVNLPDVRQELIPQPLSLRSTGDQARDVHELDGGRNDLLRVHDRGERLQPGIRHRHHAHVGIDGAERVILGRYLRACERVEQGRLAYVRQTYYAAADSHLCQ